MRILVTGGAGFIGSNFIWNLLTKSILKDEVEVVNLDKLTYAGNLENLKGLDDDPRYNFIKADICNPIEVKAAFEFDGKEIDAVVHFAAESHVDRSIEEPSIFLQTNVIGTQVMLEAARYHGVKKFVHVSTDEVYGSLGSEGLFMETTPISPNSPYSASKAGSDLLARAYFHTYGLPVCITRCSNNYGPRQFPEKLIPLMIANALEDKHLPVYGDGKNVRDWIYVDDHCNGIISVLLKGIPGEVYNFGGKAEMANIDVIKEILNILNKPETLIEYVPDRPGHDKRYAMDITKVEKELGWEPKWSFEKGIRDTVRWYLENREWVESVTSGGYREYYQRMYEKREAWAKGLKMV